MAISMNQLQNLSEDEKNIIVEVIEALGIVKSGSKHLDGNNINLSIAVIRYTGTCGNPYGQKSFYR